MHKTKIKIIKFIALTILISLSFNLALPALAEEAPEIQEQMEAFGEKTDIQSQTELPEFIGRIIKWAIGLVGVILIAFFVYGGFIYATSAGNQERIDSGKKIMMYAIIGVIIIALAYALTSYILDALFKTSKIENL